VSRSAALRKICESPDANTVDESEAERSAQAGDTGLWRSLTCNSSQDDATVKCWGYDGHGELGQGDTSSRGDQSHGGCPAQPTLCCGGREEG